MFYARHPNTTVIVIPLVLVILLLSGCNATTSSITRPEKELNTDRPGSDIETIDLDKAQPQLCIDACSTHSDCVAWTYVKPGILGPRAGCRLKDKIPEPIRSSCCISGTK
jgi:hypothetical protein